MNTVINEQRLFCFMYSTRYGVKFKHEEKIDMVIFAKGIIMKRKYRSTVIAYKINKNFNVIIPKTLLHLAVYNKDILPNYFTLFINFIAVQLQAKQDSNNTTISILPCEIR